MSVDNKLVEIQIRTQWQHAWAVWCEKLTDQYGIGLKYGQAHWALLEFVNAISVCASLIDQADQFPESLRQKLETTQLQTILMVVLENPLLLSYDDSFEQLSKLVKPGITKEIDLLLQSSFTSNH